MNNFQTGSYVVNQSCEVIKPIQQKVYTFPVEVGALLRAGFRTAVSLCKARGYYIESIEHKSFLSSTFVIKCDEQSYNYITEFARLNS